jgi:DMSO/TMAO reductase YedYZ heme-binding membrane subunit
MSPTTATVIAMLLAALPMFWVIWALVDALRTPESVWQAAGHSRTQMVLFLLLLTVLGAVLYTAVVRPRLRKVTP